MCYVSEVDTKRKRGPKTLLNRKTHDAIVNAVRRGNFRSVAAGKLGIAEPTISGWMLKGERDTSGIYREFYEAILKAESEAEDQIVSVIQAAAMDDPKFALAYAGRRWANRWGRHDNVTLTDTRAEQPDGAGAKAKVVERLLTLIDSMREPDEP